MSSFRNHHWIALFTLLFTKQALSSFLSAPHLYVSSIQQKLYREASGALVIPTTFPEYTTSNHAWASFSNPTWTNGFFASSLYLLDTRAKLCHAKSELDWVSLGQTWSTGLLSLEHVDPSTLDHDVGFLSYPFQKELLVYEYFRPLLKPGIEL